MKRVCYIFITLLLYNTGLCFGSSIDITFTSDGEELESVSIKNITRNISIDLRPQDILRLDLESNNELVFDKTNLFKIYPNPTDQNTNVFFFNSDAGYVRTHVANLDGKVIINDNRLLPRGGHLYKLSGLQRGVYIVTIHTTINIYSEIIISSNQSKSQPSYEYHNSVSSISANDYETGSLLNVDSTQDEIVNMKYSLGDQLLFIGQSTELKNDTIYTTPDVSQLYTFYFKYTSAQNIDSLKFPQVSDALFYSDSFDFTENRWKDKSGNGNDANLVKSNCGTAKTSTEMIFSQSLGGTLQDWSITYKGNAVAVLSLSKIKFTKAGTIYNIRLTNTRLGIEYYYPCSEGTLTVYDCSGNSNHLIVSGSNISEWSANKQDDFHYNLKKGGSLTINNGLLSNPDFNGSYTNGLAPDWLDYNTLSKTEETKIVKNEKAQRFKANFYGGVRTNVDLKKIKADCIFHFSAWVYVISGKAKLDIYSYQSTGPSILDVRSKKTGEWEKIEYKAFAHNKPIYNVFASILAAEDSSEIIVGEVELSVISKDIIVPALENHDSVDALGRHLDVAPHNISKVETSITFPVNADLLGADRNNFLFNESQQAKEIKLRDIPFVNVNMVYENTMFCSQKLNEFIIFRNAVGNGNNLKSLLNKWREPFIRVYKNPKELSTNFADNINVKDVNRNFRVGTKNSESQLVVSSDNGNTWSQPLSYDSDLGIFQIYITSKGTVLIFYKKSIIKRLPWGSTALEEIHPIDENGDVIKLHTPVNSNYSGEYFKPYHKLLDLYDSSDDSNLIVWGTWGNNEDAKGASPTGIFYSTDDCVTIKRFYYFGQNPNHTDTGGTSGKNGILLGNPKNPVICRHVHEVSYNKYNNKIYITCGDAHASPELHLFETSYNKQTDTWAPLVDLISDEARCQRHRIIGIGFDKNNYMYFGSDGAPQIIKQKGLTYDSQGVYKVHIKDINDMSKYQLLYKTKDIVVNSYMNDDYMLFSSFENLNLLHVSLDKGRTWKAIDVSEFLTKWYPYNNTPTTNNIQLIKEDSQHNIFLKTPVGAYVNF